MKVPKMIPEGSAIVTAKGGKNKKAIAAYKAGNQKKLEQIINSMPTDGKRKKRYGDRFLTDPPDGNDLNSVIGQNINLRQGMRPYAGPNTPGGSSFMDSVNGYQKTVQNQVPRNTAPILPKSFTTNPSSSAITRPDYFQQNSSLYRTDVALPNQELSTKTAGLSFGKGIDPSTMDVKGIASSVQGAGGGIDFSKLAKTGGGMPSLPLGAIAQTIEAFRKPNYVDPVTITAPKLEYKSMLPQFLASNKQSANAAYRRSATAAGGLAGAGLAASAVSSQTQAESDANAYSTDVQGRSQIAQINGQLSLHEKAFNAQSRERTRELNLQERDAKADQRIAAAYAWDAKTEQLRTEKYQRAREADAIAKEDSLKKAYYQDLMRTFPGLGPRLQELYGVQK